MEFNEFESQFRDAIDVALNQLQTVTLLITQLQNQNSAANDSVQNLTQLVDEYMNQERQRLENL